MTQRLANGGVLHRSEFAANKASQPRRAGDIAGLVHRQNQMPAAEHPRREGGGLLGAEVDGAGGVEVESVQPAQRDGVVGERVQLQMSHARGESVVIPFALEACLGQHRAAGLLAA